MNAAKARLQVYTQEVDSDQEISEWLHEPEHKKPASKLREFTVHLGPQEHSAVLNQNATREQPSAHQDHNTATLASAIAESINASRLPVPEPLVFSGDPLRYKDWRMSFQTLIGRKNIPVNEKVCYLRKYVGGPAKKAIESYFLIGTDAAWNVLEERYLSSFIIAKGFRDKPTSWQR